MCTLLVPDHPLDGHTFGVVGPVTPLVDLWPEGGRLPDHICAVPKPGGT